MNSMIGDGLDHLIGRGDEILGGEAALGGETLVEGRCRGGATVLDAWRIGSACAEERERSQTDGEVNESSAWAHGGDLLWWRGASGNS
ncbi:MAG: hypothetical protein R3B46_02175 [Phycisphaerales bacterium]